MKAIRSRDKLQDDARFRLDDTFHHDLSGSIPDDLMKPHVTEVVVCNPRKTALLKEGSKGDKIDARKLAEPLRFNHLSTVYHGEHGLRTLKELGRSYLTITKDVGRVMTCVTQIEIG